MKMRNLENPEHFFLKESVSSKEVAEIVKERFDDLGIDEVMIHEPEGDISFLVGKDASEEQITHILNEVRKARLVKKHFYSTKG